MKKSLVSLASLIAVVASADTWEIERFEGRDYVTLQSVAEFYRLPAPPPILEGTSPTAHAAIEFLPAMPWWPAPVIFPSDQIELANDKRQLAVTLGGRAATINGARTWLAFPIHVQNGKALISRLDLSKVVEPRFRPEKIEGLKRVDTVVLDPGHGGHDRGALSRLGFEKDFALDVARQARTLLEQQGYKVVMTRSADLFVPLKERAAIANRIENSILVSIHFNSTSTNRDARGFEIYSMAPRGAPATNDSGFSLGDLREEPGNALDVPSAVLASSVYASLLGQVPAVDRGLKHARFAVLRHATVPATLVECGFVSNAEEVSQIHSVAWRARVAQAIVDGIDGYKLLAEKRLAPKTVAEHRAAP